VSAEVPAAHVGAYEQLMTDAAERLVAAHDEAEKLTRRRFQNAITKAENKAAGLRDRLAARRSALERLDVKRSLIEQQIQDLEKVVARTDAARLDAVDGRPDVTQAMSVLMVANELRQARRELNALRERRQVELPAERAELKNEVAALERELEVAKGEAAALETGMEEFEGTRVVASPQRSGGPTGTPWPVIIALGAILGGIAGVLAAFFAEFVAAAKTHRTGSGRASPR
jgi:chromosome segregation ATPase